MFSRTVAELSWEQTSEIDSTKDSGKNKIQIQIQMQIEILSLPRECINHGPIVLWKKYINVRIVIVLFNIWCFIYLHIWIGCFCTHRTYVQHTIIGIENGWICSKYVIACVHVKSLHVDFEREEKILSFSNRQTTTTTTTTKTETSTTGILTDFHAFTSETELYYSRSASKRYMQKAKFSFSIL